MKLNISSLFPAHLLILSLELTEKSSNTNGKLSIMILNSVLTIFALNQIQNWLCTENMLYCCSFLLELLILSPRNLTVPKYTLNLALETD